MLLIDKRPPDGNALVLFALVFVLVDNGALFAVIVSNRPGAVTSNNATLTVH